MQKVHVIIHPDDLAEAASFDLQALDVAAALTIADINVGKGTAEIRDGDDILARLRKRGEGRETYWEVA